MRRYKNVHCEPWTRLLLEGGGSVPLATWCFQGFQSLQSERRWARSMNVSKELKTLVPKNLPMWSKIHDMIKIVQLVSLRICGVFVHFVHFVRSLVFCHLCFRLPTCAKFTRSLEPWNIWPSMSWKVHMLCFDSRSGFFLDFTNAHFDFLWSKVASITSILPVLQPNSRQQNKLGKRGISNKSFQYLYSSVKGSTARFQGYSFALSNSNFKSVRNTWHCKCCNNSKTVCIYFSRMKCGPTFVAVRQTNVDVGLYTAKTFFKIAISTKKLRWLSLLNNHRRTKSQNLPRVVQSLAIPAHLQKWIPLKFKKGPLWTFSQTRGFWLNPPNSQNLTNRNTTSTSFSLCFFVFCCLRWICFGKGCRLQNLQNIFIAFPPFSAFLKTMEVPDF